MRVFQLGHESATLLSTFKLQRGEPENNGFSQDESREDRAIKSIYITGNEQVAIVSFQSGIISCFDIKASFSWIGDVENDP